MAYQILTAPPQEIGKINDTECIGDSLNKINNNFLKLDEECQALDTSINTTVQTLSVLNPVDTATVDLTWTSSTRSLQADVKNNSIDYTKVASGMVLNCVNTFYDTASSWAGVTNTDVEINALNTIITPKLTTSKILIQIMINSEASENAVFRLKRVISGGGTTDLGTAPTAGNRLTGIAPIQYDTNNASTMSNQFIQFYDTPNTVSPVTYKIFYRANSTATFYLNRTISDTDNSSHERASSSMNLLEIKG